MYYLSVNYIKWFQQKKLISAFFLNFGFYQFALHWMESKHPPGFIINIRHLFCCRSRFSKIKSSIMAVINFVVNHIGKVITVNITKSSVTRWIFAFCPPFIDMFLSMLIEFIIFENIVCKPHLHQLLWPHIFIGGSSAWSLPLCIGWQGRLWIMLIQGNCSGSIWQFHLLIFEITEYNKG